MYNKDGGGGVTKYNKKHKRLTRLDLDKKMKLRRHETRKHRLESLTMTMIL